ncbi:MAG: hypothetical protein AAB675_02400 [Patescibacteria group bacterium]
MRRDQLIKDKVRSLRIEGMSLSQIYSHTNVPKTTIRTWIKDIKLSEDQLIIFKNRIQKALQEGRIRNQAMQSKLRIKNENTLMERGRKEIKKLTKQELLIAGVALYWAEGFKNRHEHRLGFCNSDPEMIRFYIKWLKEVLGIMNEDIILRLTLNQSYELKSDEILDYWKKITQIPRSQFTKTFYQKTQWKKQYNNDNYYGVLRVHVKESLDSLILMRGWIDGLKLSVGK